MKANERLKMIKALSEMIKQYEAIEHDTHDTVYYDLLYKLHQAEVAAIAELNKYLEKKKEVK